MTSGCAHLGRVWGPGRSAGRSDSCASREPPSQDWLDNWQPRGIPCGPISSRVCKPHLMTPPVSQGFRCWGLTRAVWHHQDRRRRGPRAHRHRGPNTREVGHCIQELAGRARQKIPLQHPDCVSRTLPGTARTPSMANSRRQPHQLQTPNTPHRRRPRRVHPHPPVKSQRS